MSSAGKGLEGVVAGETSICTVGRTGDDLRYRGYSINDMTDGTRFEEIAYLLINGNLPSGAELDIFMNSINEHSAVPEQVSAALKSLPNDTHPMDVLRTGVSLLGCFCPDDEARPLDAVHRLLATLPTMMLIWYNHHEGKELKPFTENSIAGRFLEGLFGKPPSAEDRAMLDLSLILYAEHEFNASTFAARVTTATLSDMYSAITTAIGTLKGKLHGGANEAAMEMMLPLKDEAAAEAFIEDALKNKVKIMGFGHRVYKISDPRSDLVKDMSRKLSERLNDWRYFKISEVIEKKLKEEKNLFPNADFYSASFYYLLDIPIPLYTPIFVFSRVSGWCAHVLEQRANNRLIRPTAEYTGPENRDWVAMDKRG